MQKMGEVEKEQSIILTGFAKLAHWTMWPVCDTDTGKIEPC